MSAASNGFRQGYPDTKTARRAYDEGDLARAISAYKFFYPTVSGAAIVRGNGQIGVVPNKVFGILDCAPAQLVFTANSDTPYGPLLLDLGIGPLVVELQPGPLIVCSMDVNQRWVADMGLPGPDAGKGGKHLLVGPDYKGEIPASGYFVHRASSNRQVVGARSLPVQGDVKGAKERLKTIKVYPLNPTPGWTEPTWLDVTGKKQDTTPVIWEDNFSFWKVLHETIDAEPPFAGYHNEYGELAALGIEKGKKFRPDARMKAILVKAARTAKCADAGPVLRGSQARTLYVEEASVAVGQPAFRGWGLQYCGSAGSGGPREVVLPGGWCVSGHVPARRARWLSVLAWPHRQSGCISRRG